MSAVHGCRASDQVVEQLECCYLDIKCICLCASLPCMSCVALPPGTPGAAGAALGQAETMAVAKQRLVQGREGREEAAGEGGDLTEHLTLQEVSGSSSSRAAHRATT